MECEPHGRIVSYPDTWRLTSNVIITSTDSRFCVQVNNFRFARNPPGIRKLKLIWATEAFGD